MEGDLADWHPGVGPVTEAIRRSAYDLWQDREGVPTYRGPSVADLRAVELGEWRRFRARGAILNLAEQVQDDAWVLEIAPASETRPVQHLFEATAYVLGGRGNAKVWAAAGEAVTFEWARGALFAIPLNARYQFFNASGDEPARLLLVTSAPKMLNLVRDERFVFDNPHVFADRFADAAELFRGAGRDIGDRTWKTNLVPDVRAFKLRAYEERGARGTNIRFSLAGSSMAAHISEFPPGMYKMAHRHGAGAHVVILDGQGYSLLWPEGAERTRIDWREGTVLSPPDQWYHQHLNTGATPARYLALRWNSPEFPERSHWMPQYREDLGHQIAYEDEDPAIRREFESELRRNGIEPGVPVGGKR